MMEKITALVFNNRRVELVSTETPQVNPVEDEKLSDLEDSKKNVSNEQMLIDCL